PEYRGGGFRPGGGGGGGGRFHSDRDRDRGPRRPYTPSGSAVDYKGLVEFVAKSVAEKPDEVRVNSFDRGRGAVAVKIRMADSDLGRLIGKSGRNIEALRTLVRVASLREHRKVFVDLATPRP
ncbi:MAG: KH domain-containing protein, partial [Candidatus Dormiibacterota bacterium]